jgi:hypothetical protein
MEGEGKGFFAWWPMEGEGKDSFAWWPMEGEGKDSFAWWPMAGEGKGFFTWWPMEGKGEGFFHLFPLFPQAIYLDLCFFSFDIKVLFYHGSRPLFTHFFLFLWPIHYNHIF